MATEHVQNRRVGIILLSMLMIGIGAFAYDWRAGLIAVGLMLGLASYEAAIRDSAEK